MMEESKDKTNEILKGTNDEEEDREILNALNYPNPDESQIDSIHIDSDIQLNNEEQ
jgi:hypothetical protein